MDHQAQRYIKHNISIRVKPKVKYKEQLQPRRNFVPVQQLERTYSNFSNSSEESVSSIDRLFVPKKLVSSRKNRYPPTPKETKSPETPEPDPPLTGSDQILAQASLFDFFQQTPVQNTDDLVEKTSTLLVTKKTTSSSPTKRHPPSSKENKLPASETLDPSPKQKGTVSDRTLSSTPVFKFLAVPVLRKHDLMPDDSSEDEDLDSKVLRREDSATKVSPGRTYIRVEPSSNNVLTGGWTTPDFTAFHPVAALRNLLHDVLGLQCEFSPFLDDTEGASEIRARRRKLGRRRPTIKNQVQYTVLYVDNEVAVSKVSITVKSEVSTSSSLSSATSSAFLTEMEETSSSHTKKKKPAKKSPKKGVSKITSKIFTRKKNEK